MIDILQTIAALFYQIGIKDVMIRKAPDDLLQEIASKALEHEIRIATPPGTNIKAAAYTTNGVTFHFV